MDLDINRREAILASAVFVIATGSGLLAGETFFGSGGGENLYDDQFNRTLDSDNNQEIVEFDNRSVEIVYENWNEFKSYVETGGNQWKINTTSDGEKRTVKRIVVVEDNAYRFHFRYRDDPEISDTDFLQLYRIEQIQ